MNDIVKFTKSEQAVIDALNAADGGVVTHDQLHDAVYPDGYWCESNVIRVLVYRLRKKLGNSKIESVHGRGYRWVREAIA